MTTTGDMTPIKVSGPEGLLAAVPPMLGFHPTNSLVLMCLSGDRRRIGPVARVDLPLGHDRAMAKHLTRHAINHADEVAVISYQDSRRRPPILDDLLGELDRAGVPVMDAIVVRGGRARPGRSAAVERVHNGVPVPGGDDPQVAALAAAGAMAGRSVLANRDQLRRSIAGPTGKRLRTAQRAVDEVLAGLIRSAAVTAEVDQAHQSRPSTPDHPPQDLPPQDNPAQDNPAADEQAPADIGLDQRPDLRALDECAGAGGNPAGDRVDLSSIPDEVRKLLDRAFAQVTATGGVEVEESVALALQFSDPLIRHAVLARAVIELDLPWLPTLIGCASWTPDPLAGPLCAALSMIAYRHGDGALAQVAVDRCLVTEPSDELAELMIAIMSAGIRPEKLERLATSRLTDYIDFLCGDLPGDEDDLYADMDQDEEDFW